MPEFCHPAEKLFETCAFISAPKQLEHCGYHYDRFRALYGLPVVPYGVEVCNGGSLFFGAVLHDARWSEQLTFPKAFALKGARGTGRSGTCFELCLYVWVVTNMRVSVPGEEDQSGENEKIWPNPTNIAALKKILPRPSPISLSNLFFCLLLV